ncbi:hypothetical protein Tco_0588882 [Tanacetum coccineum]
MVYCRQCALLRKKLEEVWFTICDENEIFQDFLNTSESSNDNTNVVNAPQEPFIFNQDPGKNSSQSPPHIDHHCCYGCGDSLDGIFCQRCTYENSFTYDSNLNFMDDSPKPPPQPPTFDQSQPPQFPVIHQPPQEMSIQDMEDLKQQYLYKMKSLINEFPIKDYRDEKIDIKINELKENFNGMSIEINKKKNLQQLEQVANLGTYPS